MSQGQVFIVIFNKVVLKTENKWKKCIFLMKIEISCVKYL